ncbi:MAG: ABC transporter permease [Oscillospiraceae bacterium]|jgi:spermidine/putrescine transport system permease protein
MKKRAIGSNLYLGLVFLFLYLPIIVMMVFSFNESKSRANFTGFTFKWYQELFKNDLIMNSFWNTILIAVLASVIATVVGTLAAIGISNMKKLTRKTVMNATYLPIINPEIVTGVALCLLFVFLAGVFGMQFGFATVLIAHITFVLPYVILNVLPKLSQMDKSIYEAALDLGCSPVKAYWKVVLPEIMPGIFAGFLMSFTYSLDDFIITYFVSGSGFQTLPVTIYGMVRKKVNPQINALSTILFLVVLVLLVLMNIKSMKKAKKKETNR